jgi:hypothetical protein
LPGDLGGGQCDAHLSGALEEAGLEIYSVIHDTAASTGPIYDFLNERNRDEGDGWLKKVMKVWILNRGLSRNCKREERQTCWAL